MEDTAVKTPSPSEIVTNGIMRASFELGLKGIQVAQILGISPSTISRMRAGTYQLAEGTKPYELAMLLLRVHHNLKNVMGGNVDALRNWMATTNKELGDIPSQKILTVQGLVAVLGYLEMRASRTARAA